MKILKHIPNILTALRLLSAIVLVFIDPMTTPFFVIYTFAGVSDALDGFIARRAGCTSALGARLDSLADMSFYAVMLVKILPELLNNNLVALWQWCFVGAILLIRLSAYVVAAFKFKKFASIHTYLNKATGLAVFAVPYMIPTPVFSIYVTLLCVIGASASLEELLIHCSNREYIPEQKSLILKKK